MTIMKRNKNKKRFLSVALALTMTATMTAIVPADVVKAADTTVSNPRVVYNTRDTIEFGHYLQEDTNGDGINDIDGVTYRNYSEDDSRFKAFGRMRVKY